MRVCVYAGNDRVDFRPGDILCPSSILSLCSGIFLCSGFFICALLTTNAYNAPGNKSNLLCIIRKGNASIQLNKVAYTGRASSVLLQFFSSPPSSLRRKTYKGTFLTLPPRYIAKFQLKLSFKWITKRFSKAFLYIFKGLWNNRAKSKSL